MAAGDKEIAKAAEEVATRNAETAIAHANETRKMIGELGVIVDALQNQQRVLSSQLNQMKSQLAILQQQFYQKGTTSYND